MRATTLRFSDVMLELVTQEAEADGVSVAQFCREAAIARVFFQAGRRGEVRDADRVVLMRQAFERLDINPEHGLDVLCELFRDLGHSEDADEDEEVTAGA